MANKDETNPFLAPPPPKGAESLNPFLAPVPQMQPEMPEDRERRKRQGIAMALGAGRGASYGLADFNESFKRAAEKAKKEEPGYFGPGETIGSIATAVTPFGPEALGFKAGSALTKKLAPGILSDAIRGGVRGGLASGGGQATREGVRSLESGDPLNIEAVGEATGQGIVGGATLDPLLGLTQRYLGRAKVRAFDRGVPEEPDIDFLSKERAAGKAEELPVFKDTKEPSRTKEIIEEGKFDLTGSATKASARTKQRVADIEDELQAVLKPLDDIKELERTGEQLRQEFLRDPKYRREIEAIRRSSPEAQKQVDWALNTYFNAADEMAEGKVASLFTPSKMNETKRELYDNLANKDFNVDTRLGPLKRTFRSMSQFFKDQVERAGDLMPSSAGVIRELNRRSGAMQSYRMRLKETKPKDFWQVARPAIGTGMALGGAASVSGLPYWATGGLGAAGGLAGGAYGYARQTPGTATRLAALLNLLEGGVEKTRPGLMRALSAGQEEP